MRYHHAKKIQEWLEGHQKALLLFFLPPYWPELNAVEHVTLGTWMPCVLAFSDGLTAIRAIRRLYGQPSIPSAYLSPLSERTLPDKVTVVSGSLCSKFWIIRFGAPKSCSHDQRIATLFSLLTCKLLPARNSDGFRFFYEASG
ncbi:MAG: transposase [Armatimonadetes bacterium]|nr:transposase [Armatimonadota bacterium]